MPNDERGALFDRLVEEKATCIKFAWNGFVRIYEDGEKRCECASCQKLKELSSTMLKSGK